MQIKDALRLRQIRPHVPTRQSPEPFCTKFGGTVPYVPGTEQFFILFQKTSPSLTVYNSLCHSKLTSSMFAFASVSSAYQLTFCRCKCKLSSTGVLHVAKVKIYFLCLLHICLYVSEESIMSPYVHLSVCEHIRSFRTPNRSEQRFRGVISHDPKTLQSQNAPFHMVISATDFMGLLFRGFCSLFLFSPTQCGLILSKHNAHHSPAPPRHLFSIIYCHMK